jgi:hypothetical protein
LFPSIQGQLRSGPKADVVGNAKRAPLFCDIDGDEAKKKENVKELKIMLLLVNPERGS